jgi:hypothetical protein
MDINLILFLLERTSTRLCTLFASCAMPNYCTEYRKQRRWPTDTIVPDIVSTRLINRPVSRCLLGVVRDGRKSIERQREDRDARLEALARYIPDTDAIVAADLFQTRDTRRFIALRSESERKRAIEHRSYRRAGKMRKKRAYVHACAASQMRLRFLDA